MGGWRGQWRDACVAGGVAAADVDALLLYAAGFFSNMGNYKSFGDTKLVPALSGGAATVDAILVATRGLRSTDADNAALHTLWASVRAPMFSLSPRERQLALGADQGITTYFSYDCTDVDAQLAQRFLVAHGTRALSHLRTHVTAFTQREGRRHSRNSMHSPADAYTL
jgi:dipeptidyl-peptidase III